MSVRWEKLFSLMRELKSRGVGIIFITHFLEQVYEVCDRITVLRNGELIGAYDVKDLPRVQLISKMMGKDLDDISQMHSTSPAGERSGNAHVLEAEGLSSVAATKAFDFKIDRGESQRLYRSAWLRSQRMRPRDLRRG